MFWGLIIEPGKKYSQTVENTFHISKAVLDLNSGTDEDTSLILDYEGQQEFILCHLNKKTNKQENLDLNFQSGDSISLFSHGPGAVHLSGYLLGEDDDDDDEMTLGDMLEEEEEDEDEEEEENEVEIPAKGNKRTLPGNGTTNSSKKKKLEAMKVDSDEEEEDEGEEEGEEEEEEKEEKPKAPVKPVEQPKSKQEKKKNQNKPQQQQQQQQQQQKGGKQPNKDGAQAGSGQPAKKTLPGGLIVEDLKVGTGSEAVGGKKVAVYYTGRLQQNNKQFDQCIKGQPFKFRLGGGEVIKGWDLGVVGMKIGGKRRLTIPSHLAYGKTGSPPDIPPNSALVFDVELKQIQ